MQILLLGVPLDGLKVQEDLVSCKTKLMQGMVFLGIRLQIIVIPIIMHVYVRQMSFLILVIMELFLIVTLVLGSGCRIMGSLGSLWQL
jgi:hypothetical protein